MSVTPNMDRLRLEAIERRRIEAGNLVKSRKRKLSELYCVSNLSRIREINDELALKPVKDTLLSFLEKNDIQNGHSFDLKTLEPQDEVIESTEKFSQPQSQPVSKNVSAEPSTESSSATAQLVKSAEETIDAENTPSDAVKEQDVPKDDRSEQEQKVVHQIPQSSRRPIVKKKKSKDDRKSLFNPNNDEAVDTHVLLLKEQLPAKVAEATPLAELYYLAQTLPLVKLMPSTHKVVTSTMFETALTEGKINVVHSRIEELKRQGKWSLRQPTKFVDPIRSNVRTHWDNLLSEMNWMAIDFREEKKLKIATCAFIAQSISDYWNYGKVCCVKRKPITHTVSQDEDVNMDLVNLENTTEDIETNEKDSIDISKLLQRPDPSTEFSPPTLPEVTPEDFLNAQESSQSMFKVSIDLDSLNAQNRTLLEELPAFSSFEHFDDKYDTAPLAAVSKSLIPVEDDSWYNVLFKQIVDESSVVPAQQKGLFGFSSQKRINTSIKPPPPPSLKYLDLRTPTIWLPEDDQNLIEYVNQFSFNWGVVSAYLSKKPTRSYSSNIERRTPWQCFERYIQLNDTFQINDMRGQNTLSAMKWLEHAHNIQATTKRRISPLGVGVDSIQRGHKRLRWASMFEAIRKCMRKRESVTRPNNTQVRKSADDKKLVAPTPAELSKLKFERDKAIQEAYMQNPANGFRGRMPTSGVSTPNRPVDGHSANAPIPIPVPGPPAVSAGNTAAAVGQTNGPPRSASQSQVQSQNQQQQAQQRFNDASKRPNSVPVPQPQQRQSIPQVSQTANNGQRLPQAGTAMPKVTGPNGTPYTPEQIQQLMQMRQRKMMQQQAQSGNVPNIPQSSPSPNNLANAQIANPQVNNNMRSNSNPHVSSTSSPLIGQSQPLNANNGNARKLTFVPAHVSAIINQIQSQNPNMSKQEVTKIAAQYLANLQAKQHRANSLNGGNSNTGSVSATPVSVQAGAQSRPQSSQASPIGVPNAKLATGVPTPQQILQQQGMSSSPTNQSPNLQQVQPQQQGRVQQQSPTIQSPRVPIQQASQLASQPSTSLTPQQKAQLDMLKVLHAEQQQKRQQQQQNQNQQQYQQFQQQQLQQNQSQNPQSQINSIQQGIQSSPNKLNAKNMQSKPSS